MIPGSNLLDLASRVIRFQGAELLPFVSREQNAARVYVNLYGSPVPIKGSVQPVPATAYAALGLERQKNYIMVWSSANIAGVGLDTSSDRIRYDSRIYKAVGDNDWRAQDGWNGFLFVEVQS